MEVKILGASRIVGSELSVAGDVADTLLVANTRASSHILQRVITADNRQVKQFLAVFDSRLLEIGG